MADDERRGTGAEQGTADLDSLRGMVEVPAQPSRAAEPAAAPSAAGRRRHRQGSGGDGGGPAPSGRRARTRSGRESQPTVPLRPAGRPGEPDHGRQEYSPDAAPALAADGAAGQVLPTGLTAQMLLRSRPRPPSTGWRKAVYRTSLGLVRLPPATAERRRMDRISRARTPVASGHHRVAVMSMKGGVGKTTTTVALGSMLASVRADRVIALDANPDRGTLSDKLPVQTGRSVRDLLEQRASISRYADIRAFTTQTVTRLEVVASDQNPAAAITFSEADYYAACAVLERFYSVCLTDCGTGMTHSAMSGVLRMTDQIVLVTTASVDSARSGSATLDWLISHGHQDLAETAVVVLNAIRRPGRGDVDLGRLEAHFAARCRTVVLVPYDAHLARGAEVELDQLAGSTAEAYLSLAAAVGDGFAFRRTDLRSAQ
ncbi:MAG TPA: MinD/ParA family protein [Streptosporangiaceae bacterium]|nr:MinD/ParA family protein [Streptosporangiaceae bacterium]